ncbi:putative membrane protein [Vibrio parahaemolyticus NIHCB0757]|nr:putative membrane protein [Vibrio parahaemolyticus NIHCB0757]
MGLFFGGVGCFLWLTIIRVGGGGGGGFFLSVIVLPLILLRD